MPERRRKGQRSVAGRAEVRRPSPSGPVRLNRFLAQCGIASRRKADDLISEGRVTVNGQVVTELGTSVAPGDEVRLNGKLLTPRRLEYILLNKPTDIITTRSDERGRATVMDLIAIPGRPAEALYPVGRLDRDTTGALLITNDGELANRLMHPRYEVPKVYVVKTGRPVSEAELDRLRGGLELEDGPIRPSHVARVGEPGDRKIALEIHEGRNRIVRRMIAALGHEVESLDRTRYGRLSLGTLRRGKWRRLSEKEIVSLRRAAGLKSG